MNPIIEKHIKPGYDCTVYPCKNKNPCTKDNSHGRHADQWHYVAIAPDRVTALELVVYTDIYPAKTPSDAVLNLRSSYDYPIDQPFRRGAWLSMHASFTLSEDDVREAAQGTPCDYLKAPCFDVWSSATYATDFFAKFGGPNFEQSSTFFDQLRNTFLEIDKDVRAQREAFRCSQCPTCKGKGVTHGNKA